MRDLLHNQVRLEVQRHAAGEILWVRNDLFVPVEIELSLSNLSNVLGAPKAPIRWILKARSSMRLVTMIPRDPKAPIQYQSRLQVVLGDPRLTPKVYAYPLPWKGGSFRLTQEADGRYIATLPPKAVMPWILRCLRVPPLWRRVAV